MVIVGLAQFRGVHLNTPAIPALLQVNLSSARISYVKRELSLFSRNYNFQLFPLEQTSIEIYQTEYYKTYGSNFRNSTSNHAIIKEAHRKPPSTASRSFLSHAKKDQNKPLLSIWLHYCLNITPVRAH